MHLTKCGANINTIALQNNGCQSPIFNSIFVLNIENMSIWRVILSILFPPLAVIDKGCGSILIVLLLTLLGWVPGVIAALIILNNPKSKK